MAQFTASFAETVQVADQPSAHFTNHATLDEGGTSFINRTQLNRTGVNYLGTSRGIAFARINSELKLFVLTEPPNRSTRIVHYDIDFDALEISNPALLNYVSSESSGLSAEDEPFEHARNFMYYADNITTSFLTTRIIEYQIDAGLRTTTYNFTRSIVENENIIGLSYLLNRGPGFVISTQNHLGIFGVSRLAYTEYDLDMPTNYQFGPVIQVNNRIYFALNSTVNESAQIRSIDFDTNTGLYSHPIIHTLDAKTVRGFAYWQGHIYTVELDALYRYDFNHGVNYDIDMEGHVGPLVQLKERMGMSENLQALDYLQTSKALTETVDTSDTAIHYRQYHKFIEDSALNLENRTVLTGAGTLPGNLVGLAAHRGGRIFTTVSIGQTSGGRAERDRIYSHAYDPSTGTLASQRRATASDESLRGDDLKSAAIFEDILLTRDNDRGRMLFQQIQYNENIGTYSSTQLTRLAELDGAITSIGAVISIAIYAPQSRELKLLAWRTSDVVYTFDLTATSSTQEIDNRSEVSGLDIPSGYSPGAMAITERLAFFGWNNDGSGNGRIDVYEYEPAQNRLVFISTHSSSPNAMTGMTLRGDQILTIEGGQYISYDIVSGIDYTAEATGKHGHGTSVSASAQISDKLSHILKQTKALVESAASSDNLLTRISGTFKALAESASASDAVKTGIKNPRLESGTISDAIARTVSTPAAKVLAESADIADAVQRFIHQALHVPEGVEVLSNREDLTSTGLESSSASIAYHAASGKLLVGDSRIGSTDTIRAFSYDADNSTLGSSVQVTPSEDYIALSFVGMVLDGNTIFVADKEGDDRVIAMDYNSSNNTITNQRVLAVTPAPSITVQSLTKMGKYLILSDANRDFFVFCTYDLTNNTLTVEFEIDIGNLHDTNEVVRGLIAYGNRLVWSDTTTDKIYSASVDFASHSLTDVRELADSGARVSQGMTLAGLKLLLLNSSPLGVVSWDYAPQASVADSVSYYPGKLKQLAESASSSDVISTIPGRIRHLIESGTISDAISGITTSVQAFSRTITENVSASDAVRRIKDQPQRIAESMSISDAVTRARKVAKSMAESMSAVPNLVIQAQGEIIFTELVSASDAVSRIKKAVKALVESATGASEVLGFQKHEIDIQEGHEHITGGNALTGAAIPASQSSIAYHAASGKIITGHSRPGTTDTMYSYDYDAEAGTFSNAQEISYTGSLVPLSFVGLTIFGNTIVAADNQQTDRIIAMDYDSANNSISNQRALSGSTVSEVAQSLTKVRDDKIVVSDARLDRLDIYNIDLEANTIEHQFSINLADVLHDNDAVVRALAFYGKRLILGDTKTDKIYSGHLNFGTRTLEDVRELADMSATSSQGMTLAGLKLLILTSGPHAIEQWTYHPHDSVDDVLDTSVSAEQHFAESSTIADVIAAKFGKLRILVESSTISDAAEYAKSLISRTLAESASISDSLIRKLKSSRNLAESASISDATAKKIVIKKELAETPSITDGLDVAKSTILKTLAEAANIADAISAKIGYVIARMISMSISDAAGRIAKFLKAVPDSAVVSDNIIFERLIQAKIFVERIDISASNISIIHGKKRAAEAVMSTADALQEDIMRILSETASISDTVTRLIVLTINRTKLKLSFKRREFTRFFKV